MRYRPHVPRCVVIGFGFIVAFGFLALALRAGDPPPDLVRRVAARETLDEQERNNYTWRQTFTIAELNAHGMETGRYREVRDVLFSPEGKRTEELLDKPSDTLTHIKLTNEDFADLRDIQPLLLTTERLFMYESHFKGDEPVDGVELLGPADSATSDSGGTAAVRRFDLGGEEILGDCKERRPGGAAGARQQA